jgi:hypothetical protein
VLAQEGYSGPIYATQEVSGLKALTPADEQHCLAQFDLLPEEGRAVTP